MFNYLAEAVGLIIKCDSVFQTSQLQNIWCQYVSVITGNSQLSHNDITGFENLLSKIGYLLSGHLFQVTYRSISSNNIENCVKNCYMKSCLFSNYINRIYWIAYVIKRNHNYQHRHSHSLACNFNHFCETI